LVDMVQQFAKLGEAVQVLGLPHEMQDAADARPLVVLGGAIQFKLVGFSYPNGQHVLQGFGLEVPAGQKVGLVGRSGAGKSTLISLL
jgi:ATP-binding cassette, subfamily B, bacterial